MEKGKVALNLDQLGTVTGGARDMPPSRYHVGDRVSLQFFPEYGVGEIRKMYLEDHGTWVYTVEFDKGTITALESEFSPA